MAQNFDLSRTADELTTYAAERQAGFEQHRLGNSFHHPETRNEWVRDILRGMAEVNGADGGALTARFDRQLEEAHECFGVEMLSQAGQKHAVQALRRYASALEQLDGDQRGRLMRVRDLLEDMAAYLPWDPRTIGINPARNQVTEQLLRLTAQRPIRFTRVLLGGELDPGGIEFLPGMVNDIERVRGTQEFHRLAVEYPKREEWPALCVVCMGGGRLADDSTIDADELDMAVIRAAGDAFMKRPEVRPVWSHQLAVSVHEQIRVLKVEPGKAPEEITMSNTLEAFQAAVGGDIEAMGLDSDACLICNELGKLIGLPANRRVNGEPIAGTFLIVGCADGDFCSLSDEDAAYYDRELSEPMPSYGEPDQPAQWEFRVL